ncbi:hypothetical protein K458DRAFT_380584 [Lentithecium fluviatile CBS 122367]|uniref:Protein kinase domain-containing protein n=1 Tax=Lentithecium fluviatile CBS 122367 TaxID=1168545 RepID=A0A6G1ICV4_9PLEO|nr:hypothetical protein K458DRAFT_380584 [Lentithecium fluviatile CBS 122367]
MCVNQPQEERYVRANIRTKRDLTLLSEVEDYATGAFIRSKFNCIDDENVAWFGQAHFGKYDLIVDDLNRLLLPVPNEKIYLLQTASIPVTELIPRMLLEEAEILQFLKQHLHPNIIKFHGCTINRGRFAGIALERHNVILQYRHEDVPQALDIDAFMRGIRAGVAHLHSLGFAHNDLNPTNIALGGNENPILLDFGSCRKFGEDLLSGGTFGWVVEDYSTSARRHDESAMDKIEAWLVKIGVKATTNA